MFRSRDACNCNFQFSNASRNIALTLGDPLTTTYTDIQTLYIYAAREDLGAEESRTEGEEAKRLLSG